MRSYSALSELKDIYLEDSYVLGICQTERQLIFNMDTGSNSYSSFMHPPVAE